MDVGLNRNWRAGSMIVGEKKTVKRAVNAKLSWVTVDGVCSCCLARSPTLSVCENASPG